MVQTQECDHQKMSIGKLAVVTGYFRSMTCLFDRVIKAQIWVALDFIDKLRVQYNYRACGSDDLKDIDSLPRSVSIFESREFCDLSTLRLTFAKPSAIN